MKRWIAVCFGLLLSAALLAGCGGPSYAYEDIYLRLMEPCGTSFFMEGTAAQTVVGEHTYEFEGHISEKERDSFVNAQEKLCAYLEEQGVSTAGMTFRIFADYVNRTESEENCAYFGLDTKGTWRQALTTIQVVFGDYTNYGYLYALANETAGELKWEREKVTASETVTPELLNLVYPCFDEAYTSVEEIAACKALAVELLDGMENIWDEAEFLQARADYAESHGIEFSPTYLTFAYNSESCPLKLRTEFLEIFKDRTYVEDYVTRGWESEDAFVSVQKMIGTFEWLDEQLEGFREMLNVEVETLVPVQLLGTLPVLGSYKFESGGYYYFNGKECNIYANTIHVLGHEYVHHLYRLAGGCDDPAYEQWCNETVAYYLTLGERFEMQYLNFTANGLLAGAEERIGEPYDEYLDYVKLMRINMRLNENVQYEFYLKYYNDLCSCFGEYFVRTYGEELFLDCMLHPSQTGELTGKTLEQIVDDWSADMADPAND